MKPVAIFLYDYTGLMAEPWLAAGYECWLFDGQHLEGITREGNLFKVGMWFHHDQVEKHAADIARMVGGRAAHVFGFPECTQLTVAGARHFAKKAAINPMFQQEALSLCMLVPAVAKACSTDCWAFENPVSVISTMWRKPNFSFDPAEYGGYLPYDDVHPIYPDIYPPRDAYNKHTCIWNGLGTKSQSENQYRRCTRTTLAGRSAAVSRPGQRTSEAPRLADSGKQTSRPTTSLINWRFWNE